MCLEEEGEGERDFDDDARFRVGREREREEEGEGEGDLDETTLEPGRAARGIDGDEVCVEQFDELFVEDSDLPFPGFTSHGQNRPTQTHTRARAQTHRKRAPNRHRLALERTVLYATLLALLYCRLALERNFPDRPKRQTHLAASREVWDLGFRV